MKYNALIERFDSINQMLSAINTRKENSVFAGSHLTSKSSDHSFTRTRSFDESMTLITNGWDEPLEEIKKGVANGFKSNATLSKSRPQTGIVGYAPCVPNAILGLPNSMIMTEKTPSKVKAVTILFSMSVTANYSQNDILKSGIVVLNIVNELELAGYRVKLDVEFFGSASGRDVCSARVNVKDWRQPLDLKKLAFPISHPSMFRRFGFRWVETQPNLKNRDYRYGYGSSNWKSDYETALRDFKESGMLDNNEYLITTYLCVEERFDRDKIIERCGLKEIRTQRKAG